MTDFTNDRVMVKFLDFTAKENKDLALHLGGGYAVTPSCLSDFFVAHYSQSQEWVADLFAGRGTTAVSALFQGRKAIANDLNPLTCTTLKAKSSYVSSRVFNDYLRKMLEKAGDFSLDFDLEYDKMPPVFDRDKDATLLSLAHLLPKEESSGEEEAALFWLRYLLSECLLGRGRDFYFSLNRQRGKREVSVQRNCAPIEAESFLFYLLENEFEKYAPFIHDYKDRLICLNQDAANFSLTHPKNIDLFLTVPPELAKDPYISRNALKLWVLGFDPDNYARSLPAFENIEEWASLMKEVMIRQQKFLQGNKANIWLLADDLKTKTSLLPALLNSAAATGFVVREEYVISLRGKSRSLKTETPIRALIFG